MQKQAQCIQNNVVHYGRGEANNYGQELPVPVNNWCSGLNVDFGYKR